MAVVGGAVALWKLMPGDGTPWIQAAPLINRFCGIFLDPVLSKYTRITVYANVRNKNHLICCIA